MSTSISVRPDGVGVITLNNGPVNSLSQALVTSFKAEFPKLVSDPKVKATVVTGNGNFFCGGAEISEFAMITMMGPDAFKDASPVAPLSEMMDLMDHSPKTTVAALNGMALGGGLEVALACHYRVAGEKIAVGLPEVKLGLLPGGQGTQRLPRVCPLQKP
jgi:enoyl-CoA hydratase/carnithine racemase